MNITTTKIQESAEARVGTNKQDAAGSAHGATSSNMVLNDTGILTSNNASIGSNEQVIHWSINHWYMFVQMSFIRHLQLDLQMNTHLYFLLMFILIFLIYFCR